MTNIFFENVAFPDSKGELHHLRTDVDPNAPEALLNRVRLETASSLQGNGLEAKITEARLAKSEIDRRREDLTGSPSIIISQIEGKDVAGRSYELAFVFAEHQASYGAKHPEAAEQSFFVITGAVGSNRQIEPVGALVEKLEGTLKSGITASRKFFIYPETPLDAETAEQRDKFKKLLGRAEKKGWTPIAVSNLDELAMYYAPPATTPKPDAEPEKASTGFAKSVIYGGLGMLAVAMAAYLLFQQEIDLGGIYPQDRPSMSSKGNSGPAPSAPADPILVAASEPSSVPGLHYTGTLRMTLHRIRDGSRSAPLQGDFGMLGSEVVQFGFRHEGTTPAVLLFRSPRSGAIEALDLPVGQKVYGRRFGVETTLGPSGAAMVSVADCVPDCGSARDALQSEAPNRAHVENVFNVTLGDQRTYGFNLNLE